MKNHRTEFHKPELYTESDIQITQEEDTKLEFRIKYCLSQGLNLTNASTFTEKR